MKRVFKIKGLGAKRTPLNFDKNKEIEFKFSNFEKLYNFVFGEKNRCFKLTTEDDFLFGLNNSIIIKPKDGPARRELIRLAMSIDKKIIIKNTPTKGIVFNSDL